MRVCDRHPRKQATEKMHMESTDTEVDLCEPCAKEIMKFISNVKKESVEKRNWLGKKKSA